MRNGDAVNRQTDWLQQLETDGFAIVPNLFAGQEILKLVDDISQRPLAHGKAGVRHLLSMRAISNLARGPRLIQLGTLAPGAQPVAFRVTLFDKHKGTNWLVSWHQDRSLPLRQKNDLAGWGPWSTKGGILYANAPANVLSDVLAVRVHLDDVTGENGPLRVLPGTHTRGVLSAEDIDELCHRISPVSCFAPAGGAVLMKPLLLHSSPKTAGMRRRVLHIEYAKSLHLEEGLELAVA